MIVVDASAVTEALIGGRYAKAVRSRTIDEEVAAPDLIDLEVASGLRGVWLAGRIDDSTLNRAVRQLVRLPIHRYQSIGLVTRALELRANLTTYDASYVALAERLGCTLVTVDRKIAGAPNIRCPVEVLIMS